MNEIRQRLNRLLEQKKAIEEEIALLQKEISAVKLSKDEKIELFSKLFVGRFDIYAKLWQNDQKTKEAFYPVTATFKGEDFLPLTNNEIEKHLRGELLLATYPILYKNRTKFLVLEIIEEDISKINEILKKFDMNGYFEINSKKDIFVWIFFDDLTASNEARELGRFILKNANISGKIYPNQDFSNKANLELPIALPLHLKLRDEGKTVFIDPLTKQQISDQWHFLQNVKKSSLKHLDRFIVKKQTLPAWIGEKEVDIEFPDAKVEMVLYDHLYIKSEILSKSLLDELKSYAVFDNPQIKTLLKLRKPLYNTPREIRGYEEDEEFLKLPLGLMGKVTNLFDNNAVVYDTLDKRVKEPYEFNELKYELRDEQGKAVDDLSRSDLGICVAPPGFGKTLIGAAMIKKRGCKTLIIVHKNMLLSQWIDRFIEYFGYKKGDIGYLGKGKNKLNGYLDIATMQSLKNKPEIIRNYSHLIVDECHHIPAVTFENIVKLFCGRYLLGLSATPNRKDGMDPVIFWHLGDVVYQHRKKRTAQNRVKIVNTGFNSNSDNYTEILTQIANDEKRNALILDQIDIYKEKKVLVLSDRIEHINNLEKLLDRHNRKYLSIHGSLKKTKQQEIMAEIENADLILATTSFFGEGIDLPHLNTIIFATPISYYGRLVQYLGRIGRDGSDSLAIDLLDSKNAILNAAFKKRKEGYKQMHYYF